jgi:hypothetical protein
MPFKLYSATIVTTKIGTMVTQYSTDLRSSVHATDREALDQAETLMGQQKPSVPAHNVSRAYGELRNKLEQMRGNGKKRTGEVKCGTDSYEIYDLDKK